MTKLNSFTYLTTITALLATPTSVMAHPGHDTVDGFISGMQHPFFGPDHLIAMIALGFVATRLNSRVATILTFCLGMLGGGFLALGGVSIPVAEILIVASLIAIAAVLFLPGLQGIRLSYAIPLIALFAACHGWVHVSEQPVNLSSLWYMVGMMSAALILQLTGLVFSTWLRHKTAARNTMGGAALTTAVISSITTLMG